MPAATSYDVPIMLNKIFRFLYRVEQKLLGRFGVGRLPFVKWLKRKIFLKFQPETAEIWGLTFHLDQVYGFMDPAAYKEPVVAYLRKEIKDGDTVVDVGANIGLFSCLMAILAGPSGKVFSFEPDPGNVELLRKNIEENGLQNTITIVPAAASDRTGKLKFFPSGVHGALVHDSAGSASHKGEIEVEATRIDDVLSAAKVSAVQFIKMDIIGSEMKALKGMHRIIERNPNAKIISAFCPAFLERAGTSGMAYLEELTAAGFTISDISRGGRELIPRSAFQKLVEKYSPKGGIAQGELLCFRDTLYITRVQPDHADDRGVIVDLFNGKGVEHVGYISFVKGALRGNHYHKQAKEYTYVLNGKISLFVKNVADEKGLVEEHVLVGGHLAFIPPYYSHALLAHEDSAILHIADQTREQGALEADTFRYVVFEKK